MMRPASLVFVVLLSACHGASGKSDAGAAEAGAVDASSPDDASAVSEDASSPSNACSVTDGGTRAGSLDGGGSVATQWGTVDEPALPTRVCQTLTATLTPVHGSLDSLDDDPATSQPDTNRLKAAIASCAAGEAVKLVVGSAGESGFLVGPFTIKSGVTLWIDSGVTLYASRSPADYDNGIGTCGTATTVPGPACNPLVLAEGTTGSGIVGGGKIDGRGGSLLTSGANAGIRSWWDVTYERELPDMGALHEENPNLIEVDTSTGFTLYGIELENTPYSHVYGNGDTDLTVWGVKILTPSLEYTKPGYACPPDSTPADHVSPATCFTPDTVKNTAGILPGDSTRVLVAYSYVSGGDDMIAINADATSAQHYAVVHDQFYYGHGISVGSITKATVSDLVVTDVAIDGHGSDEGGALKIKSDSSAGGLVTAVTYEHVCVRNVREPLVFDSYYDGATGTSYPRFQDITVRNFRDVGSAAYPGAAQKLTFTGYDLEGQDEPIGITLDNVVFDGAQPTFAAPPTYGSATDPAAVHFTLGPGEVSFGSAIVPSADADVTTTGTAGASTPIDCSSAFVTYCTVVADSPI